MIDSHSKQNSTLGKFEQFKFWYRDLPDKKRYLEVVTAFLSIPVLVTVIINNLNTLKSQNNSNQTATTPTIIIKEVFPSTTNSAISNITSNPVFDISPSPSPLPTGHPECQKEIGHVEIRYPLEDQIISKNPLCIDIFRNEQQYCPVQYSYRINTEEWSEFMDKSICLYDMPPGNKKLTIRIKSTVTDDEISLQRNFVIVNSITPTPNTATVSATPTSVQ